MSNLVKVDASGLMSLMHNNKIYQSHLKGKSISLIHMLRERCMWKE